MMSNDEIEEMVEEIEIADELRDRLNQDTNADVIEVKDDEHLDDLISGAFRKK